MTYNAPITEGVRAFVKEKLGGIWPTAPRVVEERRTECPIIEDTHVAKVPRVRKIKTCSIGVHTVKQQPCRNTGGQKTPSTKLQPTGIISPVPYPKWKTDSAGDRMPSVCTRKGNGLGNPGVPTIEYEGGTHKLKNPPQSNNVGKKVIGYGKRLVTYKEKATKAEYIPQSEYSRKDEYVRVEQPASVVMTADERVTHSVAVAAAIKATAVNKAIKKELKAQDTYTPKWPEPTGGEATTPRRDDKPVVKGPTVFKGRAKKRKNKKGFKYAPSLATRTAMMKTVAEVPLDVRLTADEKAMAKMLHTEEAAYKMNTKHNKHTALKAADKARKAAKEVA